MNDAMQFEAELEDRPLLIEEDTQAIIRQSTLLREGHRVLPLLDSTVSSKGTALRPALATNELARALSLTQSNNGGY